MTYTIVISDLHGMSSMLDKALWKVWDTKDVSKIVFTGDYIDRGPDSAGVVKRVRTLVESGKAVALKGNHEVMMIDEVNYWIPNGGDKAIESYLNNYGEWDSVVMNEDREWMKSLPLYYQDQHRIYVHGYAPPTVEDPDNFSDEPVLWGRYDKSEDYGWFGKHVVHGHTPVKKPDLKTHRTNLDTGAVFGGPLSVGVFDDSIPGGPVDIWEILGDV